MAKGKHAPAKGAVREDKVIHPKSRKAQKLHHKEQRKLKMSGKLTVGGQRLQVLGNYTVHCFHIYSLGWS